MIAVVISQSLTILVLVLGFIAAAQGNRPLR